MNNLMKIHRKRKREAYVPVANFVEKAHTKRKKGGRKKYISKILSSKKYKKKTKKKTKKTKTNGSRKFPE